jgi:hypothetical protein
MISIRKYLNSPREIEPERTGPPSSETLSSLCSQVLEYIGDYVVRGESPTAREEIGRLRALLGSDLLPPESAIIRDGVRRILVQHSSAMQDATMPTAVDMRYLAGILNQAVAMATNGEERSLSGLQKIQETLQRAARIPDLVSLKAALVETIQWAREEACRQRAESARELAAFRTEIMEARQLCAQNPHQRLPGRLEAVRNISEGLQSVPPDHALYVIAFAFDQLHAVTQRYGPEAAEDVIFRLIRERVQPLAPANSAYRWTPQSLVAVFERPSDLKQLQSEAAALNRSPMVQRISSGNRTALVTLSPSYLVAEGRTGLHDVLIAEVDRVTGAPERS